MYDAATVSAARWTLPTRQDPDLVAGSTTNSTAVYSNVNMSLYTSLNISVPTKAYEPGRCA